MEQVSQSIKISEEESAILEALLYFDVFKYPMKPSEIHQYVSMKMSPINVVPNLNYLENQGLVMKHDGFFSLSDDKQLIARRLEGNQRAISMLKSAKRYSRLISHFPFVRAVCISGSLSKGFVSDDGDVDYFIITKPGRLWITRTLLVLFKKVFLLNSRKYFCVNYFVDTDHLEIPDKNLFTATEIQSLLPIYNARIYEDFMEANSWSKDYLPNHKQRATEDMIAEHSWPIKALIEALLSGGIGNWLDALFMKLTMKRWQSKFKHFTPDVFDQALRSRKYVSKHHPQNFQKRVLDAIAKNRAEFAKEYNISLP